MKYIHVKNWDRYQHPDTKRHERAVPWIKSYTQQLSELEYLELSYAERGLLEALRLQYALNRGAGIELRPTVLNRLLGQPARKVHVERLSEAGFLVITASETLAERLPNARLDSDKDSDSDKTLATASREDDSFESQVAPDLATSGADVELERGADDADADIVIPSRPLLNGRPRDEVWDELERLFGEVSLANRSAHKNRNRVRAELVAIGATAELVRLAARRWTSLYPSATLTDSAIAKHWPQLTAGARKASGLPACEGCGVGGGFHAGDCPNLSTGETEAA